MDNVFVQKNSKKIDACIVTLDSKNRDIMNNIQDSEDIQIPILEKEKEYLKTMITDKTIDIGKRLDMRDRINTIRRDIRDIKNRRKDYLLDNAEYIFDYFESKKKISEGKNVTTVLTDFFNIH